MYLCQEKGDHRLIDIAHKVELSRAVGVSVYIAKAREIIKSDIQLNNKIVQYFT